MINLKLTVLAVLFSTGLFAQKFYFAANAGYAIGASTQIGWFQNYDYVNITDPLTGNQEYYYNIENVRFSLGKGFGFGGSLGYMFNDYVGIDVGLNYLLGAKTEFYDYSKTEFSGIEYSESKVDYKLYSRTFRVIPTLVITPGFEKLNPYVKFGAVMGFGAFYMDSESQSYYRDASSSSSNSSATKTKFTQPIAVGFNSALGASYVVSDGVSLFGELSYIGMRFSPTKSALVESTINGENDLPGKKISEIETEYVNSYHSDDSNNNSDEPTVQTKVSFAAGSIGLNFGVKINL